jgi:hypothetical protein
MFTPVQFEMEGWCKAGKVLVLVMQCAGAGLCMHKECDGEEFRFLSNGLAEGSCKADHSI